MIKINNGLSRYFKGVNFMTPVIKGYFQIEDYVVEISYSSDFSSKFGKMTGLTIMKIEGPNTAKTTNLSFSTDGHLTIEESITAVQSKLKASIAGKESSNE